MTDNVTYVSPETYDQIVRLLDQARDIESRCKTEPMMLAQKLALLAEAKAFRHAALNMRT
jgi:hypothetical protein